MKNILITGGLGYIGGRVATYLKKAEPDSNIIIADKRYGNKKLPAWTKDYKFVPIDIADKKTIGLALKNIDTIIHLAALNEIDSMRYPELALEINAKGTYNLLDQAKFNKVREFIYFSTFHVYGMPKSSIITEETPTRPFHPYAITHRVAEDFVNYFRNYHHIKGLVLRLSNSYGYPVDRNVNRWTLVFNDLCKQAVTTGKIVLKSSGKQHRDFIALKDVSRAVHHFIFNIPDKWGDGLYNLGGACSMSILQVAKRIAKAYKEKYNKNNIVIKTSSRRNELNHTRRVEFNINKLLKTGFRLRGNMEEEIDKTLAICKEFI
ncbi:MAG: SDR family oxidoreductase [Planctomycetes bacterium]|nr:SDR family oxidoreductase [Planctomycetota bacterium]